MESTNQSTRRSSAVCCTGLLLLCLQFLQVSVSQADEDCRPGNTPQSYPDYVPCPAGMTLVLDERFESFDPTVWERSTGGFPDNSCRFVDTEQHVRFEDGKLHLVMQKKEVAASYSRHELKEVAAKSCASGELRSLKPYGPYGRLEARMRTPESSGFIQSLFFFHFYKNPWQELDIELQGRLADSVSTNIITNKARDYKECDLYACTHNTEQHKKLGFAHSQDWHVYTIDWLPDATRFYVDGKLKRETRRKDLNKSGGNYPHLASTILMNFWLPDPKISAGFGGNWSYDQLPLVAQYDWVRFYRLDQDPSN